MKKYAYYTILFLLVTVSGCRVVEVQSVWPPAEINVDGQPYDWEKDTFITLMNKNIGMGIQNDSENLYIIFAIRNRVWIDRMQRSGMYLWFDTTGEMKRNFGLRYICRLHIVEVPKEGAVKTPAINPPGGTSDYYVSIDDYLTVRDRAVERQEKIIPDGSSGPAANFSPPTKFNPSYIYEFSIPLKKTDDDSYGIGAKPGQVIYFGLEWGGMDDATRMRIRQMIEMGMDPSMVRIPPLRDIWIKIKLAEQRESKNDG